MFVTKRDGSKQEVRMDAITDRLRGLTKGLDTRYIDVVTVAMKVVQGLHHGVTTRELDQLAAEICAYSSTFHPDWSVLAARIAVSNLHKETEASFSKNCETLHRYRHPKTGLPASLIAEDVYEIICANAARFDAAINYERDYDFDYFGFKTLERSYLLKVGGAIGERPQQMYMRVAIGIHKTDVDAAIETYELMSQRFFTHATPTLFNGGTPRPQLSSCFLLMMKEDSISGIYDTLKNCACISKFAGGIGLSIHNIRATNSYIRGTNGESNGIVPMLRVFSDTARYVDQGGGKRKGGFAIYLEPWHADVFEFLDLKKNNGREEMRARDLFYALWIPDLFMQRVEANEKWSLFCPNEAPGLADVVGADFKALYEKYEIEGKFRRQVNAQELWFAILDAQVETGNPYMLYKDACNLKSNQQHLGVIKSSNLCTEVVEYTSPDEIAVCNLASIALNRFVESSTRTFDFDHLVAITKIVTKNLNKVIDVNFYPVEEARKSNMRHRPIGIGIQGLADAFAIMRFPFDSPEAAALNRDIFEAIYFGAVWASCELAEIHGPYETYAGSPASKGILQPDMWGVAPSGRFDWAALRARVARFGLRNSLLVAPMPTASTAQILGNNESIEPFTSNMYSRRVLAGDFPMVNRHLMRDLIELDVWSPNVRNHIIADQGSIQKIPCIPSAIKDLYKTVWEIKQRALIDMSADRGAYICQSQSLNLFIAAPDRKTLTSMHFYGWKRGLKTGMYYLRTKPKADAIQFTVDQALLAESRAGPTYEEIVAARAAHVPPPTHMLDLTAAHAAARDEELVFGALSPTSPAKDDEAKGKLAGTATTAPAGSSPGEAVSGASDAAAVAKAAARAARAEEMAAIKARMRAGIFDDVEAPSEECLACGS